MDTSLIDNVMKEASAAQNRVERAAQILADLMQRIHGGNWRVQISHESGAELVLVALKPARDLPITPKPEVA